MSDYEPALHGKVRCCLCKGDIPAGTLKTNRRTKGGVKWIDDTVGGGPKGWAHDPICPGQQKLPESNATPPGSGPAPGRPSPATATTSAAGGAAVQGERGGGTVAPFIDFTVEPILIHAEIHQDGTASSNFNVKVPGHWTFDQSRAYLDKAAMMADYARAQARLKAMEVK